MTQYTASLDLLIGAGPRPMCLGELAQPGSEDEVQVGGRTLQTPQEASQVWEEASPTPTGPCLLGRKGTQLTICADWRKRLGHCEKGSSFLVLGKE